jgi:hypothetical protein
MTQQELLRKTELRAGQCVAEQKSVATFPRCGKLKTYCELHLFIPRSSMVLPMVVLHRRVPLVQALS